jgi:hypothetical protein
LAENSNFTETLLSTLLNELAKQGKFEVLIEISQVWALVSTLPEDLRKFSEKFDA